MDKLNILSFNKKVYNTNINSITPEPMFFNDTVNNNLKGITRNKKEINNALKLTLLDEKLNEYKKKMNANVNELSLRDKYFLSFSRVILTKCEIIMIYDIPKYLTDEEIALLKDIIQKLKHKKTVLIFTNSPLFDDIKNKEYIIRGGEIDG